MIDPVSFSRLTVCTEALRGFLYNAQTADARRPVQPVKGHRAHKIRVCRNVAAMTKQTSDASAQVIYVDFLKPRKKEKRKETDSVHSDKWNQHFIQKSAEKANRSEEPINKSILLHTEMKQRKCLHPATPDSNSLVLLLPDLQNRRNFSPRHVPFSCLAY